MSYLSTRFTIDTLPHALLITSSASDVTDAAQAYIAAIAIDPADYLFLPHEETIKVAETRKIIAFTSRTRSTSPIKLIIIPNAAQLTPEAANALLKTLEEPPPHTHFILGAANPEDLLPTVLSRCQLIQLPVETTAQYKEGKLNFSSLSEAFALSKSLATGDTPLDTLLRDWVAQSDDPSEQQLLLTYLTYLSTNPNRRLFLDNLFLERYNSKLKPQR
jgi:hypothetical protein